MSARGQNQRDGLQSTNMELSMIDKSRNTILWACQKSLSENDSYKSIAVLIMSYVNNKINIDINTTNTTNNNNTTL